METEGYNYFLELRAYTLPFISRGRFWARFGMVGIVGLGWIIVDLSRYKIKEEKKGILGGVDVMIKVFISS